MVKGKIGGKKRWKRVVEFLECVTGEEDNITMGKRVEEGCFVYSSCRNGVMWTDYVITEVREHVGKKKLEESMKRYVGSQVYFRPRPLRFSFFFSGENK